MYSKIIILGLISLFSITQVYSQDKPEVTLGGALRFNYNFSSWKDGQKERGGDFGFDVFRLNAKAKYKGLKLNAEYRLYSEGFGGGMLKQGWVGYDLNEKENIQIGLTQVPFGITQYNSHSWFFSMNYYVGLEDDHDMGIKYTHKGKKLDYALAFFKNAEELQFGSNTDASDSRYSYDVGSLRDGTHRNKEVNQVNAKVDLKLGEEKTKHKIGVSGQYGGLYNLDTEETGDHYAAAIHYELNAGKFDVKAQAATYKYNAENPVGESDDVIAMTAYGYPYLIASEANVYTIGAAYSIPVEWGPITNIQLYNDFGYLDKANSDFEDSMMNVTGALISAGNVYTYVDFAAGKDQPWLGPVWTNGLGSGSTEGWEMRFNINIGYYF